MRFFPLKNIARIINKKGFTLRSPERARGTTKGFRKLIYPSAHKTGWLKKVFRNFRKKSLRITLLDKRQRFAIQTIALTTGVLVTGFMVTEYRPALVLLLAFSSYLLTVWSLREDIRGSEWILLFLLPVGFTISVSLFYFLLPQRMVVRVTVAVVFAVGSYAILLAENIYNVSAQRSIQLLRAAQSVGYSLPLVVVFLSTNIVYSLRLPFFFNGIIVGLVCFVLSMQSLWTVKLPQQLDKSILIYSAVVGIVACELALVLSFWPTLPAVYSLLLTSGYYCIVGLVQQYLAQRLFGNMVREYVAVFVFILMLTVLATKWG